MKMKVNVNHLFSAKTIMMFRKLLAIMGAWTVASFYFIFMDYATSEVFAPIENRPYYFIYGSLTQFFGAIIGSFLFGFLEIFILRDSLRKFSLGKIIFIKSMLYIPLFISITLMAFEFYSLLTNEVFFTNKKEMFFSYEVLINMLNWSVVIFLTVIFLEISEYFGEGRLLKFLTGKYHSPVEENRLFMFIDITGSTTIAEKLGHQKYFSFLNDFFFDVTNPIIYNHGEVYQYVGDEISISWLPKRVSAKSNCVKCFEEIKKQLEKRSDYYLKEYGTLPNFKGGINYGTVNVGEVGMLKKEIVYSGDVLNTTSRLVSECRNYSTDLLISQDGVEFLTKKCKMDFLEKGEIILRGKKDKTTIYSTR